MDAGQLHYPFFTLFLINFAVTFGFGISDAFFSYNFVGILGQGLCLGLAFTFYSVSKIVFGPFAGRMIEKYGARCVLGSALAAYLAVSLIFISVPDKYILLCARVMQGAACALFRPVMYYMLGLNCNGERFGRKAGFFDVSFYSALAAGPITGGLISEMFGFEGVSTVIILCCLFSLSLFLLSSVKRVCRSEHLPSFMFSVKSSAESVVFYSLLLFIFFRACGISALNIYLPVHMQRGGFTASEVGIVMSAVPASMAAVLLFTGTLADNMNRKFLTAFGGLFTSLIYMFLPFETELRGILILVTATGVFNAVSQPAVSSMLLEYAGQRNTGQTLALFNTVMGFGFACGPLIGSFVNGLAGISAVFIATGALGVAGSVSFFFFSKPFPKEDKIGVKIRQEA